MIVRKFILVLILYVINIGHIAAQSNIESEKLLQVAPASELVTSGKSENVSNNAIEQQKTLAQKLYYRKLFIASHQVAPDEFAVLQDETFKQASFTSGASWRQRSGESGLSKLQAERFPIFSAEKILTSGDQLQLRVDQLFLDSGSLNVNAKIGSDGLSQAFIHSPTTRFSGGLEPSLRWLREGWLSLYAGIGSTPSQAILPVKLTGLVGIKQQFSFGHIQAEIFSQPVNESILSYTGIRDPYTNQKWGRVIKKGISISSFNQFKPGFSFSTNLQIADLSGEDVANNNTVRLRLGLSKDLRNTLQWHAFDYFAVGPTIDWMRFSKNLNHFTLGHGGYFSPQHRLSVGLATYFLTAEAKHFILKGSIDLGFARSRESPSPCFPLGLPSIATACNGSYEGNNTSGPFLSADIRSVYKINSHLHFGASVIGHVDRNFNEKSILFFIRYFTEPRKNVWSRDIPTYPLMDLVP